MQEIPNTGGGLSGFIAWLLWQVYVYFPFEETWDWLLLVVFLAVLARGIMIPVWWRWMKDTTVSESQRNDLALIVLLTDPLWPWLVIWLFNTSAGEAFLTGRSGQPLEVAGALYWLSLAWYIAAAIVACLVEKPPYSFRDAASLLVFMHSLFAGAACFFYWHWSTASLAVFLVFSVTAVMTGAFVVLLVRLCK